MKKFAVLFLSILFFACAPDAPKQASFIFSGKIDNPNRSGFLLTMGDFSQEVKMDADGNFSAEVIGAEEGIYTLWDSVESTKVYVYPNKDLKMTMDTKMFDESIVYEGEGAAASNYLVKKYIFEEENNVDYKELYSMEEADFVAKISGMAKIQLSLLMQDNKLDENFVNSMKKSIDYSRLNYISNYKSAHSYYAKKPDFEPSADFLKPLENIAMDNEKDYKNSQEYKNLVASYYTSGDVLDNITKLESLKNDYIKNDLLGTVQYSMRPGIENLDEVYNRLSKLTTDDKFNTDLKAKYEKYLGLAPGNASPLFNYPDTEGRMVSLEDLKGKVVYVDVWATWCGPCLGEIPSLKILESEYHGKNIEFVSISIDRVADHGKWLKMVSYKELKGIQLFADKDWKSQFAQDYGIEGIPRFILIDQSGNIVSPDAPRPSSEGEIRNLINGLGV